MHDHTEILALILAGNSTFTLVSAKTGERFTYTARAPREAPGASHRFISVLDGPDNEADYKYIGMLFSSPELRFRDTKGSKVRTDAPSFRGFAWLTGMLRNGRDLNPENHGEVLPSSKCGRCGRKLTTPESIRTGLGPVCATKGS